jgi:MauM/NapG family ferredoxin protein
LRKATQYMALLSAIGLLIGSGRAGWADDASTVLLHLDPLTTGARILAARSLIPGAALALLLVASALLVGRAWCGWLCPLGTLLEIFSLKKLRPKKLVPAESWRKAKYVLLIAIFVAAVLGNLSLLFLDPLTIFVRSLSASLLPALDKAFTAAEAGLYRFSALRPAVKWLDDLLRPTVLPRTPVQSRSALLFGLLLLSIMGLNLIAERFWCRYLCPLGGLLGLLSKLSLVRREVAACPGCKLCTNACPTGTIRPEKHYASDPAECTLCLECLEACPRGAVSFPARIKAPPWNAYDPHRRAFLASLAASAGGMALLRLADSSTQSHPFWILPPGADKSELLSKCVRCGVCLGVCPTGGLQAALTEAGAEGFWTPILIPRLGYCDFGCNACGQACPTQAIPPLAVEEKQIAIMGEAHIDKARCLAWADNQDCIVCEEMCPLPEKAIELEEYLVDDPLGGQRTMLKPRVRKERCIGCGTCEYKCPVEGEAAIRVYAPGTKGQGWGGQGGQRRGRGAGH